MEREAKRGNAPKQNPSAVFPHSVSLSSPPECYAVLVESHLIIHTASVSAVSPSVADFGAEPEKIIHHFLS